MGEEPKRLAAANPTEALSPRELCDIIADPRVQLAAQTARVAELERNQDEAEQDVMGDECEAVVMDGQTTRQCGRTMPCRVHMYPDEIERYYYHQLATVTAERDAALARSNCDTCGSVYHATDQHDVCLGYFLEAVRNHARMPPVPPFVERTCVKVPRSVLALQTERDAALAEVERLKGELSLASEEDVVRVGSRLWRCEGELLKSRVEVERLKVHLAEALDLRAGVEAKARRSAFQKALEAWNSGVQGSYEDWLKARIAECGRAIRAEAAEKERGELRAQRDKLAACLEECCPDGDGEGLYEWGLYAHRDDPPEQDAWTDKAQALHDRARALLAEVRGR